jgi:hypothetical protein
LAMDDHDRRKYIRAYVIRTLNYVGSAPPMCASAVAMPAATRDRRKRDIEPAPSHVTGPAQAPVAVRGYPAAAEFVDAIHARPLAATRLGCRNGLRQAAQALLAAQDWPPWPRRGSPLKSSNGSARSGLTGAARGANAPSITPPRVSRLSHQPEL